MTDDAVSAPPSDDSQVARALNPVTGEWRGVSSKYLVVDLLTTLVWSLIFTALATLPAWLFEWGVWWWTLPIVFGAIMIVTLILTPRRVRSIGYQLRDDDLLFRRGIMFQRFVAVPFGRMQLVDITRGPLARAVGLAELKLVTAAAATGVVIPGLPLQEAEELRDHLVALAETRRAGL